MTNVRNQVLSAVFTVICAAAMSSRPSMAATAGITPEVTESEPAVREFLREHSLGTLVPSGAGTVRMIYLVPADRAIRRDHAVAIGSAIIELQAFYQDEMGLGQSPPLPSVAGLGQTFALHDPLVEAYQTSHPADFYSTGPNAEPLGFWSSVLQDGFEITGGGFYDPDHRWIFYVDADPACGQLVGGVAGVALLPANDLRGLVGEPRVVTCPAETPDPRGLCRWVGGLGHELGHAFGLPHPPGCDAGTCSEHARDSLMYLGYGNYPDTWLLEEDERRLREGAFFSLRQRFWWPSLDCRGGATF
ncbi:MAG: hypothetical protein ACREQY_17940 [Candidatus Binatia bacterium]